MAFAHIIIDHPYRFALLLHLFHLCFKLCFSLCFSSCYANCQYLSRFSHIYGFMKLANCCSAITEAKNGFFEIYLFSAFQHSRKFMGSSCKGQNVEPKVLIGLTTFLKTICRGTVGYCFLTDFIQAPN